MRGVNLLLVVLVAANLLAFAWWKGWTQQWLAPTGEASPVARQVAPERVQSVPLARFEAARRRAGQAACFTVRPLEPAVRERVEAWVRGRSGAAAGEPIDSGYRITFQSGTTEAELKAQLAELSALAGREPAPCAN